MKRKTRAVLETHVTAGDGKQYVCRLRRFSEQTPSAHIVPSDGKQRVEVWELLDDMNGHPTKYRRFQINSPPFVVEEQQKLGVIHRIESVRDVNVGDQTPKVELWYKVDEECHGVVIVYLKPRSAPMEFKNFLIDDEEMTNFTPTLIMSYIDAAMRDSVFHGTMSEIEWEVHEAPEGGRPSSPLFRVEEQWTEASINREIDDKESGRR